MAKPTVFKGRFAASIDGDMVVFLIGARVNKPWKLRTMKTVAGAMTAMQKELRAHPELGCLHIENYGALRNISVQYWRSFEHLERYARSSDQRHLPAWRAFNKAVADNGDVGIWHETYCVAAGQMEAVYGNMPRCGLAQAGEHHPAGRASTAARRVGVLPDDEAPVAAY